MLIDQHVHDLPLLSLMASELGRGSSLQMMPSLPDGRMTITSTSEARWYAVDPDLKRANEMFLRKQRLFFDEFAECCLRGFRRIFPRVTRTSIISTAGQVIVTDNDVQFAGDIIMIGYRDGSRQYVPYRHPFGVTRRQETWNMVSRDIESHGITGRDALMSLIDAASHWAASRDEKWRLSFFDPLGVCWTGTICPFTLDEDPDHTLYALPTKDTGDGGMLDPFASVY
jgi:hypothetical protein